MSAHPSGTVSRALPLLRVAISDLELRVLGPADQQLYVDFYTDAEAMRFIAPPMTVAQARRSFGAALRVSDPPHDGPLFIAIIEAASALAIGLCAVQQLVQGRAEIGVMVKTAAQGRGVATRSLTAVIEWGFSTLRLQQIWVRFAGEHFVAQRLVRSIGLVCQTTVPSEGRFAIWSIDRTSWLRKQEKDDVQCSRVS